MRITDYPDCSQEVAYWRTAPRLVEGSVIAPMILSDATELPKKRLGALQGLFAVAPRIKAATSRDFGKTKRGQGPPTPYPTHRVRLARDCGRYVVPSCEFDPIFVRPCLICFPPVTRTEIEIRRTFPNCGTVP